MGDKEAKEELLDNKSKVKKELEDYVNEVSYGELELYIPSEFALEYLTFIKLVNGESGEEHKSPIIHLDMIDNAIAHNENLYVSFRGSAKALSLDTNIITPDGKKPMRGISVGSKVFDRNGKETTVIAESGIFTKPMYKLVLDDGRELKVSEDHINIVLRRTTGGKFKELNLTTKEILEQGVYYKRKVSSRNPEGREIKWFIPLNKPVEFAEKEVELDPYTVGVILGDGSIGKDGFTRVHSHIDDVDELKSYIPYKTSETKHDKRRFSTVRFSINGISKIVKKFIGTNNCYSKSIPEVFMISSYNQRLELLRGLLDTDGTVSKEGTTTSFTSVSKQLAYGVADIVRSLGGRANITANNWKDKVSYRVFIMLQVNPFKLKRKANRWKKPNTNKTKHVGIVDIAPIETEPSKCIAVDSSTHSFLAEDYVVTHNTTALHEYMTLYLALYKEFPGFGNVDVGMYVSDTIDNGVKSMRQNLEFRYSNSDFLKKYVPETRFTDVRWEFTNRNEQKTCFRGFGASTGVRGFKEYGQRPTWCGFDDLMSDKNAESPTITRDIRNIIYKAARQAMHPSKRKIIWTGTPFNKKDPLYDAASSTSAWNVKVYPVCEKFPCSKEEFKGAWEDRFPYEFVKHEYDTLLANNEIESFDQELMLRITSEEGRLVQDGDMVWYTNRSAVIRNKSNYNFYITTDFATSEKTSADYSVISVWAYTNDGTWLWVDGVCKQQLMDKTIDDLFRLISMYKPMSVGIEVTGQQGGFIQWIQNEMINRNIFFNLASENNSSKPGIRPNTDKMQRFIGVLPLIKQKKIWFPEELKGKSPEMVEMVDELRNANKNGFKSKHDDFIDTISMLLSLDAYRPSSSNKVTQVSDTGGDPLSSEIWEIEDDEEDDNEVGSTIF